MHELAIVLARGEAVVRLGRAQFLEACEKMSPSSPSNPTVTLTALGGKKKRADRGLFEVDFRKTSSSQTQARTTPLVPRGKVTTLWENILSPETMSMPMRGTST